MDILWDKKTLGDCIDTIIDYRGKTPKKSPFGVPLITAKIVKSGQILPAQEFILEKDYDSWMTRGKLNKGDVIITTEAPLGEVAQLEKSKVALAQRVIALRGKSNILDNTYLRFLLQSNYIQEQLKARSAGTTVFGINKAELKKIILPIPPIKEQKKISDLLNSIENKIQLYNQMNSTLDSIIESTFKSWFVDFSPVIWNAAEKNYPIPGELLNKNESFPEKSIPLKNKLRNAFPDKFSWEKNFGWLPESWGIVNLHHIADFINGGKYEASSLSQDKIGIPIIKIAEVKQGISKQTRYSKSIFSEKHRIQDGEILFCWSGNPDTSIGTFIWTGGEAWLNQHIFRVIPKDKEMKLFIYCQLKALSEKFTEIARNKQTTGLGHVTKKELFKIVVPKCKQKTLDEFNLITEPLLEKKLTNISLIKKYTSFQTLLFLNFLSGYNNFNT